LGRALLGELSDLSPVPVHIRVHHLLTSGNGQPELKFSSTNVYHEDAQGHPVYDFTILDGIFDAYKAAGIQPLVEFGFMPKDLAANLPDRTEPYEVHFPSNGMGVRRCSSGTSKSGMSRTSAIGTVRGRTISGCTTMQWREYAPRFRQRAWAVRRRRGRRIRTQRIS
jgi:hypothetical protein